MSKKNGKVVKILTEDDVWSIHLITEAVNRAENPSATVVVKSVVLTLQDGTPVGRLAYGDAGYEFRRAMPTGFDAGVIV